MLTWFIKITNRLSSLGDIIDNDQKIRKVIRALPKTWEVKTTALKEFNGREEWTSPSSLEISKLMKWK